MKLKKRHSLCSLVLCLSMAMSGMGMGYALWHTDLSGSGGVSASGSWDVQITDARISRLSGARLEGAESEAGSSFHSALSESELAALVAAQGQGAIGTAAPDETLGEGFYLIDTQVYSVDAMAAISKDTVKADGSSLDLSSQPRYYRSDGTGATDDGLVVEALLRSSYECMAAANPAETSYCHYALVYLGEDPAQNVLMATVQSDADATEITDSITSFTDTSAQFAPVTFSSAGAWAEYTLTVTNNGTVDATLDANSIIQLDTANGQLQLTAPDLANDTIAPGQSCTFTFTVQAKADVSELNDTGTLSVVLSYTQPSVEPIPAPSHSVHS